MTKDEKKRHLILKDKNIYKGLIILAIPLMINNLLKTFHDIIDMFFVGRIPGVSAEAVSAIQLTFPVVFTFLSFGIGLSVAGTALISQFIGNNQIENARKYASQLFVISLALGIFFNIISYFGSPYIMQLMGAEGFVYDNAVQYLRIRSFELPLLFVFFSFMATRQASGDTLGPVLISGSAVVLNTILSPIFIQVLGFGVSGAAIATLVANMIAMPFGYYRLFYAKSGITVSLKMMRIDIEAAWHIIRTAIPASFGQAITAIGFGVMNGVIYSYGVDTVAAFGIGNRLTSMILHPVMAIGGVMSAYIGQNIGAMNLSRARETFKKTMILSVGTMAVGSFFLMLLRGPLIGLFIHDNPDAYNLAVEYMFYILIGLPLMGVFQTFMGTYNGTGNTHYSFIISVLRLWGLRVPLVLWMRNFTDLGSSGIWYAMLISNFVIAIVGYMLYLRVDFEPKVRTKKVKPVKEAVLKTS